MMNSLKKYLGLLLAAVLLLSCMAGCGSGTDEAAAVQSVSMLCGLGTLGTAERFAGIVSARSELKVTADPNKTVGEILVSEGDTVTEGQILFTYDMELAQLNLDKAQLELEQMRNTVASKQTEKETLEKEKARASAADQLSYTLEIEECDTEIREQNYNITLKEKDVQSLEESLSVTEYTSPMAGRVQTINENGGTDDSGNAQPLMTIVEGGTYRVKGYVNESNVNAIAEGTPVIIRSRTDSSVTWTGTVATIDWENPVTSSSSDDYYVYSDSSGTSEMTSSSKYPFYVELDGSDGLLLGQHVYIEPDYGQESGNGAVLALPESFLFNIDGTSASVWAENKSGKLEKRSVTLGDYDADLCTYVIDNGLSAEDYIAYPEDSLKAGMACEEYDSDAFDVNGDYSEDYGYTDESGEYYEGDYTEDDYSEASDMENGYTGEENDEAFTEEIPEDEVTE